MIRTILLPKAWRGFQAMELLIVFSIAAILMVLCLPHYSGPHTQDKRLRAEAGLMRLAGQMETFYAQYKTYEGATLLKLDMREEIANKHYRLAILNQSNQAYEIAAIPEGEQAENDQHCGTLTLNSQGMKKISGTGNLNQCW